MGSSSQQSTGAPPAAAIILAAGKGTRMNSDLPKVCHPVGGRAMVCAVVDACLEAGVRRIVVVVGYKQELVRAALSGYVGTVAGVEGRPASGPMAVEFAVQDEQLGTGHAVRCAEDVARAVAGGRLGDVLVLCGDGPLVRAETISGLLERRRGTGAAAALATSVIDDPAGYGRIVRDASGRFERIVEHKAASEAQRAIREVNPSYYCFDGEALFAALRDVARNPESGEYYVTDVLGLLLARGLGVEVVGGVAAEDVLSINTPEQLAEIDRIFRSRRAAAHGPGAGPGSGGMR